MSNRLIYTYLIGILALSLLFFLAIPYYSNQIPLALEVTAKKQLNAMEANWADVTGIDRDLLLTGEAPTTESRQATIDALGQISAVRNIIDKTTQKTISPYAMKLAWSNEKLSLKGFLPNKRSLQVITKLLDEEYAGKDVSQEISIAQGQPAKWTELVSTLLHRIPSLRQAKVDLIGQNLALSAQAKKTSDKEKLLKQLQPFQGHNYALNIKIVADDVAKIRCQQQFDKLLRNNQILFDSGKASIKQASYTLLNRLVNLAETCSTSLLEIAGHTDNQGNPEKNLSLSRKRAQSVARWLIKSGVSQQRIKTIGYGSERPVGNNRTEFGRARNRRIEFIVRSN